jgi:hypothetical protein
VEPAGVAFVLLVVVACFIPWTLAVIFAARRWAETGSGLGMLALVILGGPLVALVYLAVLLGRRAAGVVTRP